MNERVNGSSIGMHWEQKGMHKRRKRKGGGEKGGGGRRGGGGEGE